ncbi:amidohydrolase [Thermococcus litoralis DSM 5473]|uniref:Amidohydrolase n=1 Tax=Thermococcus litoralis (strain ATCC 51850 / DSM 5473 / JCM 8560 / NS-C) TaxID=523849 RepID=H3ZMX8_THELN|nr:amidohydrolase [Thermococcus litoralis]EHR78668.1 amidohydrolase [Thermococcus litoralis DSM 5473]
MGGKTVLPGFIDSHMHLNSLGQSLKMLNLKGTKSIEELKTKLKGYAEKTSTSWILGFGWDQEELGRYPTREDLDEVVNDKPVLLYRTCFHAAVLNTKAIEIVGLEKDEDADPETGIIRENALEKVREVINKTLTLDDYKHFIEEGAKFVLSQGVTAVGFVSVNEKSLRALVELDSEGRLPIRVFVYLNPSLLKELKGLGLTKKVGSNKVKIMGIKVLADGSLGARTAWLSKPYADASTTGHPNISKEELEEIVREAHQLNLQMAVHAIGDKTTDMVLDVYEKFRGERNRIEHASILREDQIKRMKELGVVASVQPRFVISDWWAVKRVGKERAKWIYPFKSMLEQIVIGFGTDAPIEPVNPWETIYAAVTRGKFENVEAYHYTKDERLSLEGSLHSYTYGSAYIMHAENELGSLEEGKFGDFIVVDRDPFEVEEKGLENIKVLGVYVGGSKYY